MDGDPREQTVCVWELRESDGMETKVSVFYGCSVALALFYEVKHRKMEEFHTISRKPLFITSLKLPTM